MDNAWYLLELPAGYAETRLYDPESRRFKLLTGPVSFAVSLCLALLLLGVRVGFSPGRLTLQWEWRHLLHVLTLLLIVLAYTVLHELTHGLVYKLFTHRKLTFGFTGSLAYCGVPGIYVKRNVAAASCLAPFVLYTVIFLIVLLWLPLSVFWFVLLLAFMNHLGGCFADVYAFFVMMRDDKSLLMEDKGKEQHLYTLQTEEHT